MTSNIFFKVKIVPTHETDKLYSADCNDGFLVDCGATCHIIYDDSKLISRDENFNPNSHTIELADNSRQTGLATARGDAKIRLMDSSGVLRDVILKNTLCIPSYKQNIISVTVSTVDKSISNDYVPNALLN